MYKYKLYFYIYLLLGICLYAHPFDSAYASDAGDCPTYSYDKFKLYSPSDSRYATELRKYEYAYYCDLNDEDVAPADWAGPYDISGGDDRPDTWTEAKPLYISSPACDVDDPDKQAHHEMSWYMLPKDCADKRIEYRNFYVTLKFEAQRGMSWDCDSNPLMCVSNFTKKLAANDEYFHWGTMTQFTARMQEDRLCIYSSQLGFLNAEFVDCRRAPEPPPLFPPRQACWVAASCTSWDAMKGHWFAPASALVVQCIQETMNNIFALGQSSCAASDTQTIFQRVQSNVRDTVRFALILYIVLIGFKVMLGEMSSQKDLLETLLKIGFVLYFSVGEGWQDYFRSVTGAVSDLSYFVFSSAVSSHNFCNFPMPGRSYDSGYSWLRLWDMFDCKTYYYLGFREDGYPKLIMVALGNLFGFAFFVMFLTIMFLVYFIQVFIYITRMYLMVIMAITVLVYISPLMFPLMLFKPTEKFFKKWLDELIGYVLFPMILFAAVGLLVSVFDSIFWGDATMSGFDASNGALTIHCGDGTPDNPIIKSMGCYLESSGLTEIDFGLFRFPLVTGFHGVDVLLSVVKGTLFLFLFATFMQQLNEFAGNLTDTFRTIQAISVKEPDTKELMSAAKVGVAGGAGGLAQGAMLAGGGKDKEGEDRGGGEGEGSGVDGGSGGKTGNASGSGGGDKKGGGISF